jgi:hypothetical protein
LLYSPSQHRSTENVPLVLKGAISQDEEGLHLPA